MGCVATIDFNGRTIFVADPHRDDGKRYVVHADEKLTAFLERVPKGRGHRGDTNWCRFNKPNRRRSRKRRGLSVY